ncbi:MAG: ABC transporter ATP-binding protein [Opitutaceae bacterium]|nr:ABC transporter ATP-binding protein [Opitutaceae bacterium]
MTPVVEIETLERTFHVGPLAVHALRGVSLRIMPGETVAIDGPSGSGKSTLLNLLGLLDRPDAGTYRLDGRDLAGLDDDERTVIRNRTIGFVFQSSPMLPRLTAEENIAVPLVYRGERPYRARRAARRMLGRLGLETFARHRPHQLSGGQLQRVAIARALVGQPRLILADEPTASLDPRTAAETMRHVREHCRATGAVLVLISHDLADHAATDRRYVIDAGRLQPADHVATAP